MNKESLIRNSDATIPRLCRYVEHNPDFLKNRLKTPLKNRRTPYAEHCEFKLQAISNPLESTRYNLFLYKAKKIARKKRYMFYNI